MILLVIIGGATAVVVVVGGVAVASGGAAVGAPKGILPEEIRRKLEAPVSDLLYMLLTCHAKFVENFDILLHMLLACW